MNRWKGVSGRSLPLILMLAMALLPGAVSAGTISFDLDMQAGDYEMTTFEGHDMVWWPEGVVCFEEGSPALPSITRCFVIPQGMTATGAEIEVLTEAQVGESYDLMPVRSMPLGSEPGPVYRNPAIYLDDSAFPSSPVVSVENGNRTGFRLATATICPFRYNPVSGRLSVITSARVTLSYDFDPSVPVLSLTDNQVQSASQIVATFVDNPGDLASCRPSVRSTSGGTDWGTWVVIGAASLESTLQPLVDLRNSLGMSAEFVSLDWIYSNYTGYDSPEKIRNYLKDAFQNHGLIYALVVGDWSETHRISSLFTSGVTLNETADLYYSDLDNTWDSDGDHLYGENTDGLDYYADISVGRFSSNTTSQIASMVQRTVEYETAPLEGAWRTSALLCGAGLWPESGYWGSFVCDSISNRIPDSWTQYKLYENSSGHPTNQIDILNQGVSYVSPQGHGFSSGIYWYYNPANMITNQNYTGLTNWGKLPVLHSIACLAGELSVNGCVAERLMMWTGGGMVAVMCNSNNGYGSPPSMGPSEHLEVHFANQLFVNGIQRVGDAQAAAKDAFKAAGGMSMQNWVLQENNLLGDPALLFVPYQTGVGDGGTPQVATPVLGPAWPNPVSSGFSVAWSLPQPGSFRMSLFDISGRLVRSFDEVAQASAQGVIAFDGLTQSGEPLSAGVYLVRLDSEAGTATSSVMVIR